MTAFAPSSHANDFYLTLPSNSSLSTFPENSASSFKVKLPYPVQLRGKWEVGLAEIHYPRTFKNFPHPAFFTYSRSTIDSATNKWYLDEEYSMYIPAGHYETPEGLIEAITSQLDESVKKRIYIAYSKITGKLKFWLDDGIKVDWGNNMFRQIFGVKSGWYHGESTYTPRQATDMNRGFQSIFVYTDVISPVLVGDASVQLLKVLPIEGSYGDLITHTYSRLHYVPLLQNYFDSVEINISKDTGEPIQFDFGKVIVKLHVRPRKLAYM